MGSDTNLIGAITSDRFPGFSCCAADHMRSLAHEIFWCVAAICIVAQVALLRSAFTVRPSHGTTTGSARWKEIAWAVLPALTLAVLLVATWRTLSVPDPVPHAHSMMGAA
jgi:heme/copper-type cytochrome/quinol oxidase subunit 2